MAAKQYDYLCEAKCFFRGRMYYPAGPDGPVYTFPEDVKPPRSFKFLGDHVPKLSSSEQITALRVGLDEARERIEALEAALKAKGGSKK